MGREIESRQGLHRVVVFKKKKKTLLIHGNPSNTMGIVLTRLNIYILANQSALFMIWGKKKRIFLIPKIILIFLRYKKNLI
jgi:hypothetical protein